MATGAESARPAEPWGDFPTLWRTSTADDNVALYSFRRFKTTHLLNLRFLESEVAKLDHKIFQAGLSLGAPPSPADRLGLGHSNRDGIAPPNKDGITEDLVLQLRDLLREYDDALLRLNSIMSMDTFSLIDDATQCRLRDDLTLHEMYKTRLLRVDQGPRTRHDPLQRWLQKWLRRFRYRSMSRNQQDPEKWKTAPTSASYQHTLLIATFVCRISVALVTAAFLVVPMAFLPDASQKGTQFLAVSICAIIFTGFVSILLRTSNLELMLISAAYAAILSVFISGTSTCE